MKILNFGSLNIDYVYTVDHFVKKGETISSPALNIFSGGKGLNQSIALKRAGADVYHAGAIGKDGLFLEELLNDTKINTEFLFKLENVRTGNAIIQNDKYGDNCIILYSGANGAITKDMVDSVLSNFSKGDFIILQNEISELSYIVEKAHKIGIKIILNPSPINKNIFEINPEYIDYLILNEIEGKVLSEGFTDNIDILKSLAKKFKNAHIILTLGENGSIYSYKDTLIKQDIYKVNVVDTTAAGDTFVGYYIASMLNGMSVKSSLDFASKASAISVTKKGAANSIPNKDDVVNFKN